MGQQSYMNYFDFTDKVFFTLAVIILVTGLLYKFAVSFGKPIVIGGLISGFIISHIHLPEQYFDIGSCTVLGNLGIVLFVMFVGSEFNFKRLMSDKTNILVPFILIGIPFLMGIMTYPLLLKYGLLDSYATKHKFLVAMFIGIAVSMSTFSILVMFINNTRLKFSRVGKMSIFCATFEECAFWIMFGVVLVGFQQNMQIKVTPVIYMALYIIFIIFGLPFIIRKTVNHIQTILGMLAFIVVGCLLSADLADLVNLHPIFGGFVFGLFLPRDNKFINRLREHLLEFIVMILLPVYFVRTGIDASTHLSFDLDTIIISIIFIVISLAGKYGGALIVGKTWHFSNKEIIILGSLMSIRGTMEIAMLNVGYEVGILSVRTYSALVLMSLVTTWIATSLSLHLNKKNQYTP